jgi:hypothetical protein
VVSGGEGGKEVGEVLMVRGAFSLGGEPYSGTRVDQAFLQEYGEDCHHRSIVMELNGAGNDAVIAGEGAEAGDSRGIPRGGFGAKAKVVDETNEAWGDGAVGGGQGAYGVPLAITGGEGGDAALLGSHIGGPPGALSLGIGRVRVCERAQSGSGGGKVRDQCDSRK